MNPNTLSYLNDFSDIGMYAGMYILYSDTYYIFHIVGIIILFLIHFLIPRFDVKISTHTFCIAFGLFGIFGYHHYNILYYIVLMVIATMLGTRVSDTLSNSMYDLQSILYFMAIGITFSIGYMYILNALEYDLMKHKSNEIVYNDEENDYMCALYKGDNFVKYV